MRSIILYAYPPEPDGLSMQGDMLYRGMKENGEEVRPCHTSADFQKEWLYRSFRPDVAIGVGFWNHTPDVINHPQKFGVQPVPWFVADGWIANYQKEISALPLVFTTSDWVTKTYKRDGVDTRNFVTLPIGLEPDIFKPIPKSDPRVKEIRKMLGVSDDELMILTVGGDVTSKGAQEVLKALKLVAPEFKNWKYVMKVWGGEAAEDHYDDEVALIEELGEDKDKVRYIEGPMAWEFMPYLLNAADIYVAPSRLEGFGMVQVEAQACGVPVISINEMGPKETVIHGQTGFLANVSDTVVLNEEWVYPYMGFEEQKKVVFDEPKIFAYRADVGEIAEYLLRLLKDGDLRQRMGERARNHAVNKFEYHKIAKQMADTIKSRLGLS